MEPILITGCPRSGTSMTAGVINLCGAAGGDMRGPSVNNKRGMFENIQIIRGLVKPYLSSIDCDPMAQKALPNINNIVLFDDMVNGGLEWQKKVLDIFKVQKVDINLPWFYKDPKMCLIYPLWHSAFMKAKWVLVRRDDKDIVNSCLKTGFMRAYRKAEEWQTWVNVHKNAFYGMKDDGLNIKEVWPQKMINGDFTEIKEVVAWLGLEWDVNAEKFISPDLWRGGKNGK